MYEVNINNFTGPMDLLLHLIKKSNISIYDISIDDITKGYLDYINKMEQLNLDIASEYLVMAAELIQIKSSSLLPNIDTKEDPKEELINRLIEFSEYKNITNTFRELEEYRKEVYTKEASNLLEFKDNFDTVNYGVSLNDLVNAFNSLLENKELNKPLDTKITNKEYSVKIRSHEIKNLLKIKKQVNFTDLFDIYNKGYIVVTFLSILSLTKKHEIILEQESNFKNIIIKGIDQNESSY